MTPLSSDYTDVNDLPRLESPQGTSSQLNKMKKSRLQHYIKKLKKSLAEHESVAMSSESAKRKHLTTFEALETAITLISDYTANKKKLAWSETEEPHLMTTASSPTKHQETSDESSPPSPAASSTSASSVEQADVKSPDTQKSIESNVSCPDRLWGTVHLSLPDGLIRETVSYQPQRGLARFDEILKRNANLLELLQGKGAQTLLLNAFCGIPRRRMYARLRCGDQTRPFELLCEFSPNPKNPSVCSANIQILCLESAAPPSAPVVFTTRHNASCSLIYLDAASIPHLGHFPSEISGKSLFSFVHADDIPLVQSAHIQLHATNGRLVSTPGLRLVTYSGKVIKVDSEWSAFVNPWTKTIEMIVGRHCIRPNAEQVEEVCRPIPVEMFRELDGVIHSLVSRPIVETSVVAPTERPTTLRNYIDNVVESLVEKQQVVQEEVRPSQDQPILSYNQINCLENVHRLLKSQSNFFQLAGEKETKENEQMQQDEASVVSQNSVPLTRELLLQHNRKWEADCKDTWKKRLSAKRIALVTDSEAPKQKAPRIRSEPQAYSISTAPLPPRQSYQSCQVPPLPVPAPTPLDHAAWSEYVKIVQLHLQNMATLDQNGKQRVIQHSAHQRISQERQLAALAMTLQQVQIPQSTSPFNTLPTLEH